MKERNHTFDFLCGICIIRMICLHTITFCGHKDDEWWLEVMGWSFFFMCFFFFKAGYFNKTVSGDTKAYITDKTKRLLIPYVVWGTIGFIIYAIYIPFEIDRYHHPIEPMEWSHLWKTSSFWGNEPVWFLFSFWAAYLRVPNGHHPSLPPAELLAMDTGKPFAYESEQCTNGCILLQYGTHMAMAHRQDGTTHYAQHLWHTHRGIYRTQYPMARRIRDEHQLIQR